MTRNFFITLVFGFISQTGWAQGFDRIKLDNYFDTLEKHDKFMGSVAVSQKGKLIYTKSAGFSDIENNIRANENSKYRIGSISKTFTAVLALKAVEEKKLDIDQAIDKFLPSIPNAQKITVRQLLNQRSGIHNYTAYPDYLTWNTKPHTEKEMVEIISKGGSDFEPGSKFGYSNSNYILLTYIIEKSFKKSYAALLTKYITQPAGLKNTYLGGEIKTSANECKSYKFMNGWQPEPETDVSVSSGAGGIVSTPTDLVKFSDALFSAKLLKPESLELMKTIKDNYGMGLFQAPFYDKTAYGHTGGIDGFTSVFEHFSDGDLSYALTSNGTNFNNNDISIAVLSAAYNKPFSIPRFNTYSLSPEELDRYTGVYASKQIPSKITISKQGKTLMAQATGQAAFPLEAAEKDKFIFDQAGVVMEFDPDKKTMILKQGGGQYQFTKE
ncbi:MAG: beta-lactamase family protein [Sphingobacteriales bacterium]|nr:beta-lactamase family protein [Sphingobacteriales bacterium]OJY88003.1 MAG: peptidase [Sphingobacteriales bacterium 44-15]